MVKKCKHDGYWEYNYQDTLITVMPPPKPTRICKKCGKKEVV